MTDLNELSQATADAVATASASIVRVKGRRGQAASGIAYAADLVITADHVLDPSREDSITVGLADGSNVAAMLVGRDPTNDLALLRLASGTATPATGGTEPRVGALVLVAARPGAEPAAALGLVSQIGGPARTRRGGVIERFVLVDAVMYPGFSGGALVDTTGAVLGLATSGLGFNGQAVAIPWSQVVSIAETLKEHGTVPRGYLGVGSQPVALSAAAAGLLDGQERGLLIVNVSDDAPAASAGVLQGDILVRIEGQATENADDLQAALGPGTVGATRTLTVIRGGEKRDLSVVVGKRP